MSNETYQVPSTFLKFINEHSKSFGQAKNWISFYEQHGRMPGDFMRIFYAEHCDSLAGNQAVDDLYEHQPLLF